MTISEELSAVVLFDPGSEYLEPEMLTRAQEAVDREAREAGCEASEVEFMGSFPAAEHPSVSHIPMPDRWRVNVYRAHAQGPSDAARSHLSAWRDGRSRLDAIEKHAQQLGITGHITDTLNTRRTELGGDA